MSFISEMRRLYLHFKYQGAKKGILAAYDKLARYLTGGPLTRFCRVTGELWIWGQPRGAGMKTLRAHGITAVVNMRSEYDYPKLAMIHELKYLRLPTEDNGAPALADLAKGVEFVTDEIDNGGRVYVHCWEGVGRSAAMAAAYLVSKGSTPGEAWKRIRKARPFIRPNAAQIKRIEEYAAVLYD